MTRILVLAAALATVAAGTAKARPHHHGRRVCSFHHHHRVCSYR